MKHKSRGDRDMREIKGTGVIDLFQKGIKDLRSCKKPQDTELLEPCENDNVAYDIEKIGLTKC